MQPGSAVIARKRRQPILPARSSLRLLLAQEAEPDQAVVQLVGVRDVRPGFGPDARDRLGIEPAEVGRVLRCEPAPAHHRLGPPLLERRIIEIGVRPCGQHLGGEWRGLGKITGDDADGARLEPAEKAFQGFDVHRIVQAIGDRLADQRVVRDLALADQILGAGDLVGKDRRDQVFGFHARELRRHLPTATETRQRQRHARDPAPARDEHRRVEHRLDQQRPDRGGVQVARDLGQLEAVRRGEREHDVVLGSRGLQLEVELATEALA